MLAGECAVHIAVRQRAVPGPIEREPERCGVRPERVVGDDRLRDEIRARRLYAIVDVRTEVAVRPAVESAVVNGGQKVRHEIVAEQVALIDNGPELTRLRLPGETVRIAQARRE